MEKCFFSGGEFIEVLTTQPFNDGILTYIVMEGGINLGDFVLVPLGNRTALGVVWGASQDSWEYEKLKEISIKVEIPRMTNNMRNFIMAVADYTVNPLYKIFKLTIRRRQVLSFLILSSKVNTGKLKVYWVKVARLWFLKYAIVIAKPSMC